MFDQRKTGRHDFFDERIEFAVDPFSEDALFEAALINCNETGLCILSSKQLSVGQEIILHDFMDYSSRTAVITWIQQCERFSDVDNSAEILYKIGLLFS